jgi:uncharacterized protein
MRTLHCTVAVLLAAALVGQARQVTPARRGNGSQAAHQAPNPATFTVFVRGTPIGTEEVTVTRTPEGTTIRGTSRLGAPLSLTIRRAELHYGADNRPQEATLEGSLGTQLLGLHTVVTETTATSDATQGLQNAHKTDEIAADAVLLPNAFFGAYEAIAWRLASAAGPVDFKVYVTPRAQIDAHASLIGEETIRTPDAAIKVRRFSLRLMNPGEPIDAELWTGPGERLVRLLVPSQSLDYARTDIVSVAARREPVSHPGDEQVTIAANGFNLAATVSKPRGELKRGQRLPAIVLVPGSGQTDRDETVGGIPIYGQLASALADAGFIVVRYDKRGIGQSGGRAESASLGDYAEDVRAAVQGLRKRKDVNQKQIAVLGYAEGGTVALAAARQDGDIKALVLAATPGVSGNQFVLDQQQQALSRLSIPDAEKQRRIELQKKINHAAMTGTGWEGVAPAVRRQAESAWFQSFLAFDPAKILPKVEQPVLIVQPVLDREVSPENARKLEALARGRKKQAGRAVAVVDLAGLNHLFLGATTGEVDEYASLPDKTVSSRLPEAVAKWLEGIWAARK